MAKMIITISRQFGSGGAEIAEKVAQNLGIEFFDKDKLRTIAEGNGISRDVFERIDQQATNSFLYSLAMSSYSGHAAANVNDVMMSDRLYLMQAEEIRKIASNSDCVIVGRAADDILGKGVDHTSIFISGDYNWRLMRIMEKMGLSEAHAKSLIKKTDKKRASYYNFYTNRVWGEAKNYELCIDSSVLGIEETAKLLTEFIKIKYKRK